MTTIHSLPWRTLPLLLLATASTTLAGGQERVPVLMYHHLVTTAPESEAELHVDCFARQMQYLREHGFTTLTLEQFRAYHEAGGFPERSLLITFDDGYRSFLEHAHPVLREFGFNAVLFPVVGLRPGLQREIVWADHLSFHEIRLMSNESGLIEVGSHSFDLHHQTDDGLAAVLRQVQETGCEHLERVFDDLLASRLVLEQQTDREITALAWPYGVYTPELVELAVDLGFALQFTTEEGYVTADTPLTALPRFNVAADAPPCFHAVVAGSYR